MAEGRQQHQANGRLRWSERMNSDLLECKKMALELVKSDNPPRLENGRKMGYMQAMQVKWIEKGYGDLALTKQNLRDQAARLEKSLGSVVDTVRAGFGRGESVQSESSLLEGLRDDVITAEVRNANLLENGTQVSEPRQEELANLHTQDQPEKVINTLNDSERELLEQSLLLLALVNTHEGEYSNRVVDTRIKQKPTKSDLKAINNVVTVLMEQKKSTPTDNPFAYIWLANCILYSVVVTFLVLKGWKKNPKNTVTKETRDSENWKRAYLESVRGVRKKISKATAELERLKENRELTKKGKKNRTLLQKECGFLSTSSLVSYIEKQRSVLRKLKASFGRRKRHEEAKELNRKFTEDPGRVYTIITKIAAEDPDNARPKYRRVYEEQDRVNKGQFSDIAEAEGFWRALWEESGSGDENAEWLEEVEIAFSERVPHPSEEAWDLTTAEAVKVILKKKNWSAPGPDRVVNYWWKRAISLHEGMVTAFKVAAETTMAYPEWFTEGKTSLLPKPGDFKSENHRPITCLNTSYKWFTSCVLGPMDEHVDKYELMEKSQRGAKAKCSGTTDNLMIDRMVTLDCHRNKRNLSVAWIDVRKAYDCVDHDWLKRIMWLHKFPKWICEVVGKLCDSWNTKIAAHTVKGNKLSSSIRFNRGLPQGDTLCPRLFTLCINPIAWKLSSAEGYRLSKPIGSKVTNLLYVDDLKASEGKLNRVLKMAKTAMENVGLQWNPKKCNFLHARRGVVSDTSNGFTDGQTTINCLKEDAQYRFLGAPERLLQNEKLALDIAARAYLQRLSVIWSSPLSDKNKVTATNQLALPVLSYLMWSQQWCVTDLRNIDRESRKIICENGGKHPLGSTALLYLPRHVGGRGVKSAVEAEYKQTKIKSAVKLYGNEDPTMDLVRAFEEHAAVKGHGSLVKEAGKFVEELGVSLNLSYPNPKLYDEEGKEVPKNKIKDKLKQRVRGQYAGKIRGEKWQGKLFFQMG